MPGNVMRSGVMVPPAWSVQGSSDVGLGVAGDGVGDGFDATGVLAGGRSSHTARPTTSSATTTPATRRRRDLGRVLLLPSAMVTG
jgi:hypothetical protein